MYKWGTVSTSIGMKNLLAGEFNDLDFIGIRDGWLPRGDSRYVNVKPLSYKYGKIQAGSIIFEESVPFKLITSLPVNAGFPFRTERGLIILPSKHWNSFNTNKTDWTDSNWEILHELYAVNLYPIQMLWEAFILVENMYIRYAPYGNKAFYTISIKGREVFIPHSLLKYFLIPSICSSPNYNEIYCTVHNFNEMINRFDGNLSKYNSDTVAALLSKEISISEIATIVNQLIVE